ncbi:FAD-dependent oxidoreductase [Candidatus Roizmanbacteria bacterium]|nr:FAD-dependent oxidoreductase [Candidatus Roizmanbacteria bacterium]
MAFQKFAILDFRLTAQDTYVVKVRPIESDHVFSFLPGQFCRLKNPNYEKTEEPHMFSITSSPHTKDYLEFCLKVYGNWTRALIDGKVGDTLLLSGPYGRTILDDSIKYLVLLIGGVGIAPAISLLRYVKEEAKPIIIDLLYGNRNQETSAYKDEIDQLYKSIKGKVVHVLSHLSETDQWDGYKGFISEEIIKKEVNLSADPTFYMCGPLIFIQKMEVALKNLGIPEERIKKEIVT